MTEEKNGNILNAPSIPSDIYTPIDPMDNEQGTVLADADDHTDAPVKRPHLNAEVAPDSPQGYDNDAVDADAPKQQTPGHHAADRAFEYDDEEPAKTA